MSDVPEPQGDPRDDPDHRGASGADGFTRNATVDQAMSMGEGTWRGLANRMKRTGVSTVTRATSRPDDPMWYIAQRDPRYDPMRPDALPHIRALCRALYMTHPVIAAAIDVYASMPLDRMELQSKDPGVTKYHEELFFESEDSGLNYGEYLPILSREYWLMGEAWPLGHFSDPLGVWVNDEPVHPDDIQVHKIPFEKKPVYTMRMPEGIRELVKTREPVHMFMRLLEQYPEVVQAAQRELAVPVSDVLLRHLRFDVDPFNPRGIPLLTRAFRDVRSEQMLQSAQDGIADRLYTPLILAKLGANATDLGTGTPWIPTHDDLYEFEEAVDAALAGDFRMLTHHFATDIQSVFGREVMPNLNPDFDRLTRRILQSFGLSETAISGAGQGQTYAADALNLEYAASLLAKGQNQVAKFFRARANVVCEAQQQYDYESKGGRRQAIEEEVLRLDPETGETEVITRPKLLVPHLRMAEMDMRSDEQRRQFLEALRDRGIPISMETRLTNIPIDLGEETEATIEEQVEMAVMNQEVRRRTYQRLVRDNLPVPEDLRKDFEPRMEPPPDPLAMEEPGMEVDPETGEPVDLEGTLPMLGVDEEFDTSALVPTSGDVERRREVDQDDTMESPLPSPPRSTMDPGSRTERRARPPQSDEQRARMPRRRHSRRLADGPLLNRRDDR